MICISTNIATFSEHSTNYRYVPQILNLKRFFQFSPTPLLVDLAALYFISPTQRSQMSSASPFPPNLDNPTDNTVQLTCPNLDSDLPCLLLHTRFRELRLERNVSWITIPDFRKKHSHVFDEPSFSDGLWLMAAAAQQSVPFMIANPKEFGYQLYSRLIDFIYEHNIIYRYLIALHRSPERSTLVPTQCCWPHPLGPETLQYLHSSSVTAVCLPSDNDLFAFASDDNNVYVYSRARTTLLHTLRGHGSTVNGVAMSPDGRYIVSSSNDHTIRIWDTFNHVGDKYSFRMLRGHAAAVMDVTLGSDNGMFIVSGSSDRTVRMWKPSTSGLLCKTFRGHSGPVVSVAVSENGKSIVSGSKDYSLCVWSTPYDEESWQNYKETDLRCRLFGHTDLVSSVAINFDGSVVISGSRDGSIRVWDTVTCEKGRVLRVLKGNSGWVRSVDMSCDGRWIVAGMIDKVVQLWDISRSPSSESCRTFHGHSGWVDCVAISNDGNSILSGSSDQTVRCWDTSENAKTSIPENQHSRYIRCIDVSKNGRWIVSASEDRTVRLWDTLQDYPSPRVLGGHTDWIRSVAISADGRCIVSGSDDKSVRFWGTSGFGAMSCHKLEGHTARVTSVTINLETRLVTSGSDDMTVRVWDCWSFHPVCIVQMLDRVKLVSFDRQIREKLVVNLFNGQTLSFSVTPSGEVDSNAIQAPSSVTEQVLVLKRFNIIENSRHVQFYFQKPNHNNIGPDYWNGWQNQPCITLQKNQPYYCKGRFIFAEETNKRIATLPAAVCNLRNAVLYSEATRSLTVFCMDYKAYFFKL